VNEDDTYCTVGWWDSFYTWEILYDDNEADDFCIWQNAGNENAVRFTPPGHPTYVYGGKVYVGDGSFPGPFLGSSFQAVLYDDDGDSGFPGTLLDSMTVVINNYGWVEFLFPGPYPAIDSGSFYLGMVQTAPAPNAAPIGVDMDNPTYLLSYSRFQGTWSLSAFQDLMIRAWITDDSIPVPSIDEYEIARFSNFDPGGSPLEGDTTILDTTDNTLYIDNLWAGLPPGWYAYGIKSHYSTGEWSDYYVSSMVPHLMTGFNDRSAENDRISIFPNPVNEVLFVRSPEAIHSIFLYNNTGELILASSPDEKELSLSMSQLSIGIYYIQVYTHRGIYTDKLLIHH